MKINSLNYTLVKVAPQAIGFESSCCRDIGCYPALVDNGGLDPMSRNQAEKMM